MPEVLKSPTPQTKRQSFSEFLESLDGGIFAGIQYHYYRSAELSAVAVRRIR